MTACSVSSVIEPAGLAGAIGWSAIASTRPVTGPYAAAMAARDMSWVGMPSASPTASPVNAPTARSRAFTGCQR